MTNDKLGESIKKGIKRGKLRSPHGFIKKLRFPRLLYFVYIPPTLVVLVKNKF